MANLEQNTSQESVGSGKSVLGTSLKTGAKAAKKISKSSAAKKAAGAVLTALVPQAKIVALAIAMIFIPFILLISVIPSGNLFMTQGEIEAVEDKVAAVLDDKYDEARKKARDDIKAFVNEKYNAGATNKDIKYKGNGVFVIDTNTALITVTLSPQLSEMKENISAYINAVNGAIVTCGEDTKSEVDAINNGEEREGFKYDSPIFEENDDKSPSLTDEAKEFLSENSSKDTYTKSEDYLKEVAEESDSFFTHDKETKRWDLMNFHQAPKTHYVTKKVTKHGVTTTERKAVTVTAWYGDINIVMFYDLSGYRKDELDKAAEIMASGRDDEDFVNGVQLGTVIDSYYNNYISAYKSTSKDGKLVYGEDNRDEIFAKLLADGTLMYVPISGLTENYMSYVVSGKGYSGKINFDGNWDNKSTAQIWAYANSLATQMYPYNCTTFAAAWFYDHYGKNILRGNGRDCVDNLLKTKWGKARFYRSGSPSPGAIFSIGRPGGGNHVGCVEAVDFEKKLITISDGNTNGRGNSAQPWTATIRIKETMTFAQFNQYVANCCAVHGDYSPRVVFACPKKGAFDMVSTDEKD